MHSPYVISIYPPQHSPAHMRTYLGGGVWDLEWRLEDESWCWPGGQREDVLIGCGTQYLVCGRVLILRRQLIFDPWLCAPCWGCSTGSWKPIQRFHPGLCKMPVVEGYVPWTGRAVLQSSLFFPGPPPHVAISLTPDLGSKKEANRKKTGGRNKSVPLGYSPKQGPAFGWWRWACPPVGMELFLLSGHSSWSLSLIHVHH